MANRNHDGEIVTSTGAICGEGGGRGGAAGTCKEAELELLLNDPNVAIEPARVWSLVAEIAQDMRAANPRLAK